MTVRKIFAEGKTIEVTGAGYEPKGEFKGSEIDIKKNRALQLLFQGGLLCSDAVLEEKEGKWMIKGDPTEGALVVAAVKAGFHETEMRLQNPRIEEIPFSSERKRMTTIHQMADGKKIAFMKGAPEMVLEKSSHIFIDGEIRELGEKEKGDILKANEEMAQAALRVFGFAYRECKEPVECSEEHLEHHMIFIGLAGMMDPPREEAIEATRVCKQVGIKPIMITGDHKLTAVAIAREIGIYKDGDRVLTSESREGFLFSCPLVY